MGWLGGWTVGSAAVFRGGPPQALAPGGFGNLTWLQEVTANGKAALTRAGPRWRVCRSRATSFTQAKLCSMRARMRRLARWPAVRASASGTADVRCLPVLVGGVLRAMRGAMPRSCGAATTSRVP
jgi:hypothetical protein